MKTKFLLVYGYLIPFITSAVFSSLPWFFGFNYRDIAIYYSEKLEILLAFFVAIGAITFPFQTSIINEDNPHVLAVLQKTKVREVFVVASVLQVTLIGALLLLVLFLSSNSNQTEIIGYIQLFASSMITFESIALISNGRSYGSIRERIIIEVSKAERQQS
jgi:hypothetical protein